MPTNEDLRILQNLPLELKIAKSKLRIQEWYNHFCGDVYVSFSGGKDSTVLKHLVESTVGEIPSVFCDTGLEYPEIKDFVKSQNNVTIIRPEISFKTVITEYGYPVISKEVSGRINGARLCIKYGDGRYQWAYDMFTKGGYDGRKSAFYDLRRYEYMLNAPFKISNRCCDIMKKKPFHNYEKLTGCKGFLGTMAIESNLRRQSWIKNGCNAFNITYPHSAPLSFWTEQDILEYLYTYKIPYCSVYGEIVKKADGSYVTTGLNRTGCMFCMYGINQDGEINRFQRMQHTHPKIYNYCMKPIEQGGLGLKEVLSFMNIPYEDNQLYIDNQI